MTDHIDLIARLRERGGDLHATHGESGARDCADAADALAAQAREIERLTKLHEVALNQMESIANQYAEQVLAYREIESRLASAESEIARYDAESRIRQERLAAAELDAERYRWLFHHGDSVVARVNAVYRMWDGEDGIAGFEAALDAAREGK